MKSSALIPTLLLGAALALSASARADEDHGSGILTLLCTVVEVATYPNRVHVACQDGDLFGIHFFAAPTSSASEATRLVTLGSAALLGAGDLEIVYEQIELDDIESFGCLESNCRRPLEIKLRK
jgi:hypothetical protein